MNATEIETSKMKILQAAQTVFVEKGYSGARMQEIADQAGVNKAMIYYYFHSKDALFETIIREAFEQLFQLFGGIWQTEALNPEQLLPQIVHAHLKFLTEHPYLPRIILHEINSQNPVVEKVIRDVFEKIGQSRLQTPYQIIEAGTQAGLIRSSDPQQTIWNIVALDIFHFITRPILEVVWPDAFQDEWQLQQRRAQAISELLLYGLLPR
ncbi:TetR/AcrR family transcriptional regulator [candidate division KSB1 bacterium]|nr:TetR/AcrR family transcriptional regulator [candidate division KSB1 bacterium]